MKDQSVEEWARTAQFGDPVSFGDVEAEILAREPVSAGGMEWWMPIATFVSWVLVSIVFVLGLGVAVLGLLFVWLGIGHENAGGAELWLSLAQMVFICSVPVQVAVMYHCWREGRREAVDWSAALLTVAACAGAFMLLRTVRSPHEPWPLTPAIVATGVLSLAVFGVSLLSKPRQREDLSSNPPPRGPHNDVKRHRYVMTRERVLDILSERGLVKIDAADRQRLREMPLGYWEEIDGVDERERRRILEYRIFGWRDFDESDVRPWPPPGHRHT